MKIGIVGAGTWGMALARMFFNYGYEITVWSALADEIIELKKNRKHKNLPNIEIPEGIEFTTNIQDVCVNQDYILFAVPSLFVRSTAKIASQYIANNQIIVDVAKGIDSNTLITMSEIINEEIPQAVVVALSGPTHAEEVARDLPTTIVAANKDKDVAMKVQRDFSTPTLSVFTSTDIKGVEICGALKNIIALAAGILTGLGYGDNAKAALITRGLHEVQTLGVKMGCREETFSGLAGMGDLIVTATSEHSRNNRCGYLIGEGYSVKDAISQVGMVVEGVNALDAALSLTNKYEVHLPIISTVNSIINEGNNPKSIVNCLMGDEIRCKVIKPVLNVKLESDTIKHNSKINKGTTSMKRVITYGTFDLLHYGHINLLRRAKALGDYLIVAISTDEFNWNEKHKKCYFTYEQRKALVESIRYVDLVIPENSWTQKKSDIHEYHVDTFVIGDDWKGKFDFLEEEGVEVVYLPRTPEISSSKMKKDLYDANDVDGESKINHDEINTNPN